jgi:hypothetical protein
MTDEYLPDECDSEFDDFVDVGKDGLNFVRLGDVVFLNQIPEDFRDHLESERKNASLDNDTSFFNSE